MGLVIFLISKTKPSIDIWVSKMRFSKMYIFGNPIESVVPGIFLIRAWKHNETKFDANNLNSWLSLILLWPSPAPAPHFDFPRSGWLVKLSFWVHSNISFSKWNRHPLINLPKKSFFGRFQTDHFEFDLFFSMMKLKCYSMINKYKIP